MAVIGQDGKLYWVVAHIGSESCRQAVLAQRRLSPQQVNLLFVLSEHVNRAIPIDDICSRMATTETGVRILATRIRKKLHYDWTIESLANKGMRLVYIGHPLSEAPRTHIDLSPIAIKAPHQNYKYLEETRRRRWPNRILTA